MDKFSWSAQKTLIACIALKKKKKNTINGYCLTYTILFKVPTEYSMNLHFIQKKINKYLKCIRLKFKYTKYMVPKVL